jgi:hypothetical protein
MAWYRDSFTFTFTFINLKCLEEHKNIATNYKADVRHTVSQWHDFHVSPWRRDSFVGFEVLTPVVMKISIFWEITPCSPPKVKRRFRGTQETSVKQVANKAWLILWTLRWRGHFPPETSVDLQRTIWRYIQKIELFKWQLFSWWNSAGKSLQVSAGVNTSVRQDMTRQIECKVLWQVHTGTARCNTGVC